MEFRKEIKILNAGNEVTYQSKLMSIGSCFSENIGKKLVNHKFQLLQNPQGIIFNPIALANVFSEFESKDVFKKNQQYFSWRHHSSISNKNESTLIENIVQCKNDVSEYLKSATHVFVTFGSAWGYRHVGTKEIVANCHKIPQQDFIKELVSVKDIVSTWSSIVEDNPHVNWVFTISPVRHWKDGVRENNVSKGVLHQAIHQLLALKNVNYFPSYEIVLDELRDYRFFKNDMLHPNELAVDYIWEKFGETYFSKKTLEALFEVKKLNGMLSHRIMSDSQNDKEKFEKNIASQQSKVNSLLKML